jgi:hypothetical protein
LQQINLEPVGNKIKTHMGATLEPKPGVRLRVSRRLKNRPSEPIESLTSSSKVDHQR